MKNNSNGENLFRIAAIVAKALDEMQDIQETTLKKIEIKDGGNLVYITINGGLTTESIDDISGHFGDANPIVRVNESGFELCVSPNDEEYPWINFDKDIVLKTDYILE